MKLKSLLFILSCLFANHIRLVLLCILPFYCLGETNFLKREDIIYPDPPLVTEEGHVFDATRFYAEIDLTGNGLKDIIISEPVFMSGRSGKTWFVHLCVTTNQYKRFPVEIFGWPLALETHYNSTRIWGYSRLSGSQGAIQHWEFNKRGEYTESSRLDIYPGDGGTDTGNAIYNAIFKDKWLDLKGTSFDGVTGTTSSSAQTEKGETAKPSHVTATLTPEQKTDFLRMYGDETDVLKRYPENPVIGVLFFDINGDGVEEAIVTYTERMHRDGCDWDAYVLLQGEWEPVKKKSASRTTGDPISGIYARPDQFFALTDDGNKPLKLVAVDDEGVSRIFIDKDGFLIVKQFPEDQIKFRTNHEPLSPEFHTNIPPPKDGKEITILVFHEKVNVEAEPWIDDPSAIPLPSNGLWSPERERYFIDFNNDGIPDLLLGHGHSELRLDSNFTLYLKNSKGKYKKHAVFNGMPDFAIKKKEEGVTLLWRCIWDASGVIKYGYYTITDKGVSDFTAVKTLMREGKRWEEIWQMFRDLCEENQAQVINSFVDSQVSETVGGKVNWIGDGYVRPDEAKNNPNHLWLYAGILIGSLCAAFYFLRRKLKTGN